MLKNSDGTWKMTPPQRSTEGKTLTKLSSDRSGLKPSGPAAQVRQVRLDPSLEIGKTRAHENRAHSDERGRKNEGNGTDARLV
jgi:hypothetical protein